MSLRRVPVLPLSISLCIVLLAALIPAAAVAAPQGKAREYIITLSVQDSGRTIRASSKGNKQRIRQRAKSAREATDRVAQRNGVKARHRYGYAMTGFSAVMTPAEAARVATDPTVADVRIARQVRLAASETVPKGVKRVKAWNNTTVPGPDVAAHVAIIDTGIGPATPVGEPIEVGGNELNLRGGVNCFDDPGTGTNEAYDPLGPDKPSDHWWGDTQGHGTHVAGTIGARDNDVGTIGVAPGVNLWSVRVFKGSVGSETAVVCGLDWAVATHSNDTPDIDVINLSIQALRIDQQEDCNAIKADPGADKMQQAICRAIDERIVVVAAAGNSATNADLVAPGGFDQVISVGAMTDTDGVGWQAGPKAGCGGAERDDTFASYSNHGPEVDIVAPGTCVASTDNNNPNGSPVYMSGTSMAAPHVTGAVARWIADNGTPASTGYMRQLVRASGRLDWDAKTDPTWYGVNDPDPPNRVLDVAALTGSAAIKVFAYHDSFRVGRSDRSRITRVDVQRSGGYEGTINLGVAGLPGTVGSASFGDSSLNGLAPRALGTAMQLNFRPKGGNGVHSLGISANGVGVSPHSRALSLIVDRVGPRVTGLAPKIRDNRAPLTAKGTTQVLLQWTATDVLSSVSSAKLQRKTGTSAWKNAGVAGVNRARVSLKPGQKNRFRVKTADTAGNTRISAGIGAQLTVRDSRSSKWNKPAGGWRTKKAKKAYGGSILLASGPTASLRTSYAGSAVAIAASIGPSRGTFRVRVDGGAWSTVSLKSRSAGHRKVVWTHVSAKGTHRLEIQGVRGQSTLDALLIVR